MLTKLPDEILIEANEIVVKEISGRDKKREYDKAKKLADKVAFFMKNDNLNSKYLSAINKEKRD